MIKQIIGLFKPKQQLSIKEQVARISTDPSHRIDLSIKSNSTIGHIFGDRTTKEIEKKLGLVHAPKVKHTIESKATFNQRALAVNEQLKKDLFKPQSHVGQLKLF